MIPTLQYTESRKLESPRRRWLALQAALAASACSQLAFRSDRYFAAVSLTILALVIGAIVGREWPRCLVLPSDVDSKDQAADTFHPVVLMSAVMASLATLLLQARAARVDAQLACWIVSLLTLAWVYRPNPRPVDERRGMRALVALGLFGVALLARGIDLEHIPGGFYGDEGEFSLAAVDVLDGKIASPFSVGWDQHPTLFSYLQAAALSLGGRNVASARLVPALAGALSVMSVFALLGRMFGIIPALVGSLLVAVSPWHLHATRVASNNALVGMCTAVAMASWYGSLRGSSASADLRTGTWMGLCFYFGNKAVLLPVMIAASGVAVVLSGGATWQRLRSGAIRVALSAGFVLLPQLAYYSTHGWYGPLFQHPLEKLVLLSGSGTTLENSFSLGSQIERSLLGFQYYADRGFYRFATKVPLLGVAEATLFVVGLAICLGRRRQPEVSFLLSWLGIGVLGSLLTHDPPQGHHMIGISMLPAMLSAVVVGVWVSTLKQAATRRRISVVLLVGLVSVSLVQSVYDYFWIRSRGWALREITAVARAMRDLGPTHQLVLVTPPIMWEKNATVRFIAPGIRPDAKWTTLDPEGRWFEPSGRDVAFIVDGRSTAQMGLLRGRYPSGTESTERDEAGRPVVTIYRVPAASAAR